MQALSERDKRTLRFAVILIAAYLAVFFVFRGWRRLERTRKEYATLLQSARELREQFQLYEAKAERLEKLKKESKIELSRISRASMAAEVSAAIQKSAMESGVQLGPIRETPAQPAAKELAAMQLQAIGRAPAALGFMERVRTLGYPLLFDSVQMNAEPAKPGMVKLVLTVVILDFQQWKAEENSGHA